MTRTRAVRVGEDPAFELFSTTFERSGKGRGGGPVWAGGTPRPLRLPASRPALPLTPPDVSWDLCLRTSSSQSPASEARESGGPAGQWKTQQGYPFDSGTRSSCATPLRLSRRSPPPFCFPLSVCLPSPCLCVFPCLWAHLST